VNFANERLGDLLAAIAAKEPTPGGGAVAGLIGAIGAALGAMVVNYSMGRKSLAAHDELHRSALVRLDSMRADGLALAERDSKAYGRLSELWKLDKDDERRQREFQPAVREAIAAPRACLDFASELVSLLMELRKAVNRNLASDLAIAAILGEAAARGAAWNVRVNLPLLEDEAEARELEQVTHRRIEEIEQRRKAIEAHCAGS
jgi:formiminotetrahydrofolate cyclodeaminase